MALDNTRSTARGYCALAVGTLITTLVLLPGYLPAGGMIRPEGRLLLLAGLIVCAVAFIRSPRHLLAKSVTLACFTLSALLAVGFGGRYLSSLLSDEAALRVLLAYQRLGL